MKNRVKKTSFLTFINLLLVLVLAGNASAIDWDGGGGANQLWSLPANWAGDVVPVSGDEAQLNTADANCLIDSSVAAECSTLTVSYDTGTCYLNMTGGTLTTSGNLSVGRLADGNGVFIMSGGTLSTGTGRLWIGYGSSSGNDCYGTFIMTGGDVTTNMIELAKNAVGVGSMYINGGTITVSGGQKDFEIGKYGTGTVYMTAGDVNVLDKFRLSDGGGVATVYQEGGNIIINDLNMNNGTPIIYLDGGIFNCTDDIQMSSENAKIDITEGVFIADTDGRLEIIQQYISQGKIIGYGGVGYIDVDTSGGVITVTARLGDPNLAWDPGPKDYETVELTASGPTLSWKPGRYAVSHDIYFGTEWDDVNVATTGSEEFETNQDPCSYPLNRLLELGRTYYWRIDEVNDNVGAPAGSPWKGNIWRFTVADHIVVEDFDSYANDAGLEAVWSLLSNSDISLEDAVIISGNSMKFQYDDGSEASATTSGLGISQNWSQADIKALMVNFYGDAYNDPEPMYVALEDADGNSAVVYYDGDADDINEPEWHEWNIELQVFNDLNSVDLSNIAAIYIGFGDGQEPAGSGIVYFDDIRLYPTRCVAAFAPAGDMDNDCDVDYIDVNTMAGDWLETDYNGVGSDGVLMNFPTNNSQWVNDGGHQGLQFDGTDDWVDLDDSQFSDFHDKSISFWAKVREYPTVYRYLFYFANAGETSYRIYVMTRTDGIVRARFIEDYSDDFLAGTNIWRHYAFVLQDTPDGRCTGKFYADGFLIDDWNPGQPRHSGGASGVSIGSSDDGTGGFANAVYDEFRVYDYDLSASEVSYLAGKGGAVPNDALMMFHYTFDELSGDIAHNSSTYEFYSPLLSAAELYEGEAEGERVVNLKDFAVLADSWLEERLFP